MDFGNYLKYLRESHNLSQEELGKIAGVSYQAISSYERGFRMPKMGAIERMASYFGIRKTDLIECRLPSQISKKENKLDFQTIPLIGTIACGTPILATENIEEMIPIPSYIKADFCLRCKGDSMINARILNGDIVFIRKQCDVESGDIAAVLIDDEATLKRVRKLPNILILHPENPNYSEIVLSGAECKNIKIIGKAVYFTTIVK